MYQRILFAVDGSPSSELALAQALTLAKSANGEVLALYVADDSDVLFDVGYFDPKELKEAILTIGRDALRAAGVRLTLEGVRHFTKLVDKPVARGAIAATIVREAEDWNADVIVLGTHGRRGLRRLVMGSVAEGVLRISNKPVLLIRSEAEE
ncbi:universal stress protein [Cupriavidus basilensis]|uniref:universal stress protein n=1 Tax=Cupriavidus basilensis TaxID=68895 RepID=UPI0039F736DF